MNLLESFKINKRRGWNSHSSFLLSLCFVYSARPYTRAFAESHTTLTGVCVNRTLKLGYNFGRKKVKWKRKSECCLFAYGDLLFVNIRHLLQIYVEFNGCCGFAPDEQTTAERANKLTTLQTPSQNCLRFNLAAPFVPPNFRAKPTCTCGTSATRSSIACNL